MALDKTSLQNGIFQLLTTMEQQNADSKQQFANTLATLIDTYVKSGTVTVAAGIAVATSGSPTAQTGATTSTGTGTIN